MKIKPLVIVLFTFLTVGIVFGVVSSGLKKSENELKDACTEEVDAVIVRLDIDSDEDSTTYKPIYNYHYNGNEYTVIPDFSRYPLPDGYYEGATVSIMINPDNPREIYDEEFSFVELSSIFSIASKVMIGVAIIVLLFTIIRVIKYVGTAAVGIAVAKSAVDSYNQMNDYNLEQQNNNNWYQQNNNGYPQGYNNGYQQNNNGMYQQNNNGYTQNYNNTGYQQGYTNNGYPQGYNNGYQQNNNGNQQGYNNNNNGFY